MAAVRPISEDAEKKAATGRQGEEGEDDEKGGEGAKPTDAGQGPSGHSMPKHYPDGLGFSPTRRAANAFGQSKGRKDGAGTSRDAAAAADGTAAAPAEDLRDERLHMVIDRLYGPQAHYRAAQRFLKNRILRKMNANGGMTLYDRIMAYRKLKGEGDEEGQVLQSSSADPPVVGGSPKKGRSSSKQNQADKAAVIDDRRKSNSSNSRHQESPAKSRRTPPPSETAGTTNNSRGSSRDSETPRKLERSDTSFASVDISDLTELDEEKNRSPTPQPTFEDYRQYESKVGQPCCSGLPGPPPPLPPSSPPSSPTAGSAGRPAPSAAVAPVTPAKKPQAAWTEDCREVSEVPRASPNQILTSAECQTHGTESSSHPDKSREVEENVPWACPSNKEPIPASSNHAAWTESREAPETSRTSLTTNEALTAAPPMSPVIKKLNPAYQEIPRIVANNCSYTSYSYLLLRSKSVPDIAYSAATGGLGGDGDDDGGDPTSGRLLPPANYAPSGPHEPGTSTGRARATRKRRSIPAGQSGLSLAQRVYLARRVESYIASSSHSQSERQVGHYYEEKTTARDVQLEVDDHRDERVIVDNRRSNSALGTAAVTAATVATVTHVQNSRDRRDEKRQHRDEEEVVVERKEKYEEKHKEKESYEMEEKHKEEKYEKHKEKYEEKHKEKESYEMEEKHRSSRSDSRQADRRREERTERTVENAAKTAVVAKAVSESRSDREESRKEKSRKEEESRKEKSERRDERSESQRKDEERRSEDDRHLEVAATAAVVSKAVSETEERSSNREDRRKEEEDRRSSTSSKETNKSEEKRSSSRTSRDKDEESLLDKVSDTAVTASAAVSADAQRSTPEPSRKGTPAAEAPRVEAEVAPVVAAAAATAASSAPADKPKKSRSRPKSAATRKQEEEDDETIAALDKLADKNLNRLLGNKADGDDDGDDEADRKVLDKVLNPKFQAELDNFLRTT